MAVQIRCKYRPLLEQNEIRLLYLQPRSKGEEIHCILKHVKLKKQFLRGIPKYSALSYTWGLPSDKRSIKCGYKGHEETTLKIPTNLYHALKRFRHERWKGRVLWADAICINQEDISERAEQVKIMRKIFANAVDVPIWLGEHTATSPSSCSILNQLFDFYNYTAHENPELSEESWSLVADFLRLPWFTRVWVFQEGVFARSLYFVWGDWVASWREVMLLVHSINSGSNPPTRDDNVVRSGRALLAIERQRLETLNWYDPLNDEFDTNLARLVYLIDSSRHLRATDPRDMLFALQGCAYERNGAEFAIDYSSSVEKVYTEFVKYNLLRRKDPSILSSTSLISNFNMPGWVPDWTHEPPESKPLVSTAEIQLFLFASGLDGDFSARISEDERLLYVKGAIVGRPKEIGMINPKINPQSIGGLSETVLRSHETSCTFYQEAYRIACQGRDTYHTGETRIEAFLRLLCYDYISWHTRIENSEPVTVEDGMRILAHYGIVQGISPGPFTDAMYELGRHIEYRRRFCLLESGHFSWVPQATQLSDCIASLSGANIMFVLRPTGSGRFKIVGECYIHGTSSVANWSTIETTDIVLE